MSLLGNSNPKTVDEAVGQIGALVPKLLTLRDSVYAKGEELRLEYARIASQIDDSDAEVMHATKVATNLSKLLDLDIDFDTQVGS